MSENKLILKSINSLLGESFYIPSYQRGYRWSKKQVKLLLDDIWGFYLKTQTNKSGEEFYCLQPIVIKPIKWLDADQNSHSGWEVIDGQQRLTTIRIILSYLTIEHLKRPLEDAYKKKEFSIQYETRPNSEKFLKNLKENHSNIDFHYMWSAFEEISDWFRSKDYNDCNNFLSILLAKENHDHPVKVIWYEINEGIDKDTSAIDIFTRLNIGKIPLTNAELIKALFLSKVNIKSPKQSPSSKQLQIANEWDYIENRLQDKSFWHFIYDENNETLPHQNYETRIEFIFDLMKDKPNGEEKYYTFYRFLENDFESTRTITEIWLDIKRYFLTFEEWYQNRELYHLIGFLIIAGANLKEIKNKSDEKTKIEFKDFLKKDIRKYVNINIENVSYGDKETKLILLLFNIHTLLSNDKSKSRFPFDSYKNNDWDIEHIRSQSEVKLTGKDRINWAKLVLEFYTGKTVNDNNLKEQQILITEVSQVQTYYKNWKNVH